MLISSTADITLYAKWCAYTTLEINNAKNAVAIWSYNPAVNQYELVQGTQKTGSTIYIGTVSIQAYKGYNILVFVRNKSAAYKLNGTKLTNMKGTALAGSKINCLMFEIPENPSSETGLINLGTSMYTTKSTGFTGWAKDFYNTSNMFALNYKDDILCEPSFYSKYFSSGYPDSVIYFRDEKGAYSKRVQYANINDNGKLEVTVPASSQNCMPFKIAYDYYARCEILTIAKEEQYLHMWSYKTPGEVFTVTNKGCYKNRLNHKFYVMADS